MTNSRAAGETFFVHKRGLHIFRREGGILLYDLVYRIASFPIPPNSRCRNAGPCDDG